MVGAELEAGILEAFNRTVAEGLFHLVAIDRRHEALFGIGQDQEPRKGGWNVVKVMMPNVAK